MTAMREAFRRAGIGCGDRLGKRRLANHEHQEHLVDPLVNRLREIEAELRAAPGACTRVVSVPFDHPAYDDKHELAWSCRKGKWRLVLRWDDGADPVLAASRETRVAVLGSDALQALIKKLVDA